MLTHCKFNTFVIALYKAECVKVFNAAAHLTTKGWEREGKRDSNAHNDVLYVQLLGQAYWAVIGFTGKRHVKQRVVNRPPNPPRAVDFKGRKERFRSQVWAACDIRPQNSAHSVSIYSS